MQVILLSKIHGLGNPGDYVNVKPGYARNYLVPYGKAVFATRENLEYFEKCRIELNKKIAREKYRAEEQARKIEEMNGITILSKSGDKGKLFGSIRPNDISDAIISQIGVNVSKNNIQLPNGGIRYVGEYFVNIRLHNEFTVKLKVIIKSDNNK